MIVRIESDGRAAEGLLEIYVVALERSVLVPCEPYRMPTSREHQPQRLARPRGVGEHPSVRRLYPPLVRRAFRQVEREHVIALVDEARRPRHPRAPVARDVSKNDVVADTHAHTIRRGPPSGTSSRDATRRRYCSQVARFSAL